MVKEGEWGDAPSHAPGADVACEMEGGAAAKLVMEVEVEVVVVDDVVVGHDGGGGVVTALAPPWNWVAFGSATGPYRRIPPLTVLGVKRP